jgi:hypothetical protein
MENAVGMLPVCYCRLVARTIGYLLYLELRYSKLQAGRVDRCPNYLCKIIYSGATRGRGDLDRLLRDFPRRDDSV